jgi:cobalt-zinc-cadmium efflux system outer membrane protein
MSRSVVPIALAILTLVGTTVQAQSNLYDLAGPSASPPMKAQAPLTLATALRQAMDNSPELAAARNEMGASEGARIQAGAYPNPTVSAEIEDTRWSTRTSTLLLSQPIELGGKRAARMAAADRGIEVARSQFDAKRVDVQASVTSAFFAALVAQERVALAKASLDIARRGADVAGKRVTAGKVSPVEETKAKVAQSAAQIELVQAQGELRNSLAQLRGAIGPGPAITRLDGSALLPPRLPSREEVDAQLDSAPAIREARLEVRRSEALADVEKTKRVPDLTLTLGATRPNELARNQAVIGVSIPLPIFDTNRGNIQEALQRQDKAEDMARAAELRVKTQATTALQRMETSLAMVKTLKDEVLPGAQSALDAATLGFELGKFNYLEALDAQRTLLQSRSQYLSALAEAHNASAELLRLLGTADGAAQSINAAQYQPASQSLQ